MAGTSAGVKQDDICPVSFSFSTGTAKFEPGTTFTTFLAEYPWKGDGDWQWVWGTRKVSVAGSGGAIFRLMVGNAQPVDFYAPVFLHIPAASATASEIPELAMHLQSYPDGAPVGHLSNLRGQKLITRGGLGVGNSATATTSVGSLVKKVEIFDAAGASLGFVPVYSTIT
jgi:hypothetical protein